MVSEQIKKNNLHGKRASCSFLLGDSPFGFPGKLLFIQVIVNGCNRNITYFGDFCNGHGCFLIEFQRMSDFFFSSGAT